MKLRRLDVVADALARVVRAREALDPPEPDVELCRLMLDDLATDLGRYRRRPEARCPFCAYSAAWPGEVDAHIVATHPEKEWP
jgi:hypothetical protein